MNWSSWLLWGFSATIVLTMSAAAQGIGLTRMNIPYMLGTMLTPNRDKAKLYGFVLHVAAGWLFSLIYVLIFESLGVAGWWRGGLIGICHALFVLTVVVELLPGLHPRMASEQKGPGRAKHAGAAWLPCAALWTSNAARGRTFPLGFRGDAWSLIPLQVAVSVK